MSPRISSRVLFSTAVLSLFLCAATATGRTDPAKQKEREKKEKKDDAPSPQRVPTNVYENLRNRVSAIDYYTTNYGIFGLDILGNRAGGIWPRGSSTPYIFGGGIWFGAQKHARDWAGNIVKKIDGGDSLVKLTVISYNPNSGASWMVPGRIGADHKDSPVDSSPDAINKYRIYYSTEYSPTTGEPIDANDKRQGGANWPIWDTHPDDTLKSKGYLGEFVQDASQRTMQSFPKGPAIISGEDVFTTYKDTDLSRYEIMTQVAQVLGYPLGIQVEQTDYSWGFGEYANFMFLKYVIINRSTDTLRECWMSPALDMDIGQAGNDRTKIAIDDAFNDSLNLAVQWSERESQRFGYVGVDFLESPAVNDEGYIRKDKTRYTAEEQLGLQTFRNWTIQNDPKTPEERYDFMSDLSRDGDTGPGDKRFLMATGPFNLRPGDTAQVVVGIMFAYGAVNPPNGTWGDLSALLQLDRFAQEVYDNFYNVTTPSGSVRPGGNARNIGLKLGRSYPLPAGPAVGSSSATIEYSLEHGSDMTLVVIDAAGGEIERRSLGHLAAGEHVVRMDVSALSAGVYHYELRSERGWVRGELVVLR